MGSHSATAGRNAHVFPVLALVLSFRVASRLLIVLCVRLISLHRGINLERTDAMD